MKKYQVIEDNGGGLKLVVFDDNGNVEYLHDGYEYVPGQLSEDIKALENGDDPVNDWEGNAEDPQGLYDEVTSYEHGWEIVADNDGIYPDRMGAAAQIEFGPEREYEIDRERTKSRMTVLYSFWHANAKAMTVADRKAQFEGETGEPYDESVENGFVWLGTNGWLILVDGQ